MYTLQFVPAALDEWNALDGSVKEILRAALRKRLEQPNWSSKAIDSSMKYSRPKS